MQNGGLIQSRIVILTLLFLILPLNIVFAILPQPVFQTDFESAIKLNPNQLNFPIENWFEFQDSDGSDIGDGARMWVDSAHSHSGNKSIGLEVSNLIVPCS